jgi:muramidase (phage lysozyme)
VQPRILLLGAASALAYWFANQPSQADAPGSIPDFSLGSSDSLATAGSVLVDVTQNTAAFLDDLTMGVFNLSNMRQAKPEMLSLPNVKAMLATIRKGEGTADANGYRRIFGGQLFTSYADHPRVSVKYGKTTTTAAGAYQFLASTWDETKRIMGLTDFSPPNQDLAALGRIAARGALDAVLAGRFNQAIAALGKEWASIPGSPYGQPTQTLAGALAVYQANGGTVTA